MNIGILRKVLPSSAKGTGVVVLAALVALGLVAFNRAEVSSFFSSGEELTAAFPQSDKLVPYQSLVKLAGVKVGLVTAVDAPDSSGTRVEMKLDDGTRSKLGTAPSANLRPTLLLGGTYYVELVPGGDRGSMPEGGTIPVKRTTVPVELDRVLSAITPAAVPAIGRTVADLNSAFGPDGQRAITQLVTDAPQPLRDTGTVLGAVAGQNPSTDLTNLVDGLQRASAAFTTDQGRIDTTLDGLAAVSSTLAGQQAAIAQTLAAAPSMMAQTRTGLSDLAPTLDKLQATAADFKPSAEALAPVVSELDSVLGVARPVIADARSVAAAGRPVVDNLVPIAGTATKVLTELRGPVLQRLNGPIASTVLEPWHGTGTYQAGGNDHPLYKELGYLLSHTADVFKFHDQNGAQGRLMAGVGLSTPGGIVSKSLYEYLQTLGYLGPNGPHEGANAGEAAAPFGSSPSDSSPLLGSQSGGLLGLLTPSLPVL